MANTVVIFGAGASVHQNGPLMNDFVDRAESVYRKHPHMVDGPAFDKFLDLVFRQLDVLHAKTRVQLGNVESILGLVEMGKLIRRLPGYGENDIDAVERSLRTVLAQTIEISTGVYEFRGLPPGASGSYRRFVDRLISGTSDGRLHRNDVAFVSFNYDIAFELGLWAANREFTYVIDGDNAESPRVLKLHGSLNWGQYEGGQVVVTPRQLIDDQREFLQSTADDLPQRVVRPALVTDRYGQREGAGVYNGIAIVPPSWNKTQYHLTFEKVWRARMPLGQGGRSQ